MTNLKYRKHINLISVLIDNVSVYNNNMSSIYFTIVIKNLPI